MTVGSHTRPAVRATYGRIQESEEDKPRDDARSHHHQPPHAASLHAPRHHSSPPPESPRPRARNATIDGEGGGGGGGGRRAATAAGRAVAGRGAAEATLPSTPTSAAWAHIAAFCALHRYLPGIDVCELAAGEDGRPGCVRYVASLHPPVAGAGEDEEREVASWAREELLEIDHGARRLAYAVVASSMGFGRYVATMTVVADEDEEKGCRLVWAFECDPVQGWSLDGLRSYLDAGVKGVAARIEDAEKTAAAPAAGGAPAEGGDAAIAAT
nr:unnamed protein product [Digitaria exilis]